MCNIMCAYILYVYECVGIFAGTCVQAYVHVCVCVCVCVCVFVCGGVNGCVCTCVRALNYSSIHVYTMHELG